MDDVWNYLNKYGNSCTKQSPSPIKDRSRRKNGNSNQNIQNNEKKRYRKDISSPKKEVDLIVKRKKNDDSQKDSKVAIDSSLTTFSKEEMAQCFSSDDDNTNDDIDEDIDNDVPSGTDIDELVYDI